MLRRRSRVHLAAGGIAHFLLMNDQVFADLDVREDIDGSRSGITVQSVSRSSVPGSGKRHPSRGGDASSSVVSSHQDSSATRWGSNSPRVRLRSLTVIGQGMMVMVQTETVRNPRIVTRSSLRV